MKMRSILGILLGLFLTSLGIILFFCGIQETTFKDKVIEIFESVILVFVSIYCFSYEVEVKDSVLIIKFFGFRKSINLDNVMVITKSSFTGIYTFKVGVSQNFIVFLPFRMKFINNFFKLIKETNSGCEFQI